MGSDRPPRGLRLTTFEIERFRIPAIVGERFTSDMLDVHPGVFEVLEVDERGVVVCLVEYARAARGGTG